MVVVFLIHDIQRFKLDLKLTGKRISLYYFKRGEMKAIFPGKLLGSYMGVRLGTTWEEMEEIFEWLTEFPHYLEVFLIRFGSVSSYSFGEWFDQIEKGLQGRKEFRELIHQRWNPLLVKKKEELLFLFLLTLAFYEEYLKRIYLYFLKWLP